MTYSSLTINRYDTPRVSRAAIAVPELNRATLFTVLACLLGLIYLVQVTSTNALGYTVNGLQDKANTLQAENNDLQLAAARAQSFSRVKNYSTNIAMTPVTPEQY